MTTRNELLDLEVGSRYGRLVVLGPAEPAVTGKTRKRRNATSLCKCDCGREAIIWNSLLRNAKRKACSHKCSRVFNGTLPKPKLALVPPTADEKDVAATKLIVDVEGYTAAPAVIGGKHWDESGGLPRHVKPRQGLISAEEHAARRAWYRQYTARLSSAQAVMSGGRR